MENHFKPVNLDDAEKYYARWEITPRRALDYTLANLWGWGEYFGLEWSFDGDLCWIRQTIPREIYWAPVGGWADADWQKIMAGAMAQASFTRVPLELVEIWRSEFGEGILAEDERGQWEYLYKREELATLPGNRFHKKRNHLNSYVKAYGQPDYQEITPKMVEDVLGVQDVWCHWHECGDSPSLMAENDAINRVLTHWGKFRNMIGGSLYVEGKMIAFSIGEKLDAQTMGVHFEKGLGGYKGVYQAINNQFVLHAGSGFEWIDRAQDMDEEGLRQAKMTYLPVDFLKKFKVSFK